ncbi:phage baseplate assembly protein V [Sphingobacterium sp. MYb382]|uniref:phage baseplate assembly protein V n=1 Tax=Sphingobacterium sp. MYb382 TaxID=2745278 RepID=UPI00309D8E45
MASEFGHVTYSCQYEETHYNYLVRLATTHGEQFYYDGDTLRFGRFPFPEKAIQLTFGRNVDQVDIQMKALHVKPSYYGYNSNRHQPLYTGASQIKHESSLGQSAYKISQNTFTTHALQVAPLRAHTSKDLDAAQNSAAGSRSVDTFVTSGRSTVPFLYPSCLVEMEMIRPGTKKASYFTRLMIVGVEHHVDKLGNYTGHFEAVGHGTGYLPAVDYKQPKAEPQFATVIDNKDEKGRVQVRFDWQGQAEQSDWMRVLSPDAGSSEKVSKNRGFMAIPEVGDQVMVGFVHGNPDRPYVMGGLFHGQVAAGGGSGNNVKSLSSKSGHTVELNDAGGITVMDKGQNFLILDGAGNADLTTQDSITISCGASSIYINKDGDIVIKGKNIVTLGENIGVSGSATVGVGVGPEEGTPTSGIGINPTELNIGTEILTMEGFSESNLGGAKINIGGGTETNISSGTIKLN